MISLVSEIVVGFSNSFTCFVCILCAVLQLLQGIRDILQLRIPFDSSRVAVPTIFDGPRNILHATIQQWAVNPMNNGSMENGITPFARLLVVQQFQALAASREAHAKHMQSLQATANQIHKRRKRYTGPGTPPSTGVVHNTSLISSLPSCTVVSRLSQHMYNRFLALAAQQAPLLPVQHHQDALHQGASVAQKSNGSTTAYAEIHLPDTGLSSYWSSGWHMLSKMSWVIPYWGWRSSAPEAR